MVSGGLRGLNLDKERFPGGKKKSKLRPQGWVGVRVVSLLITILWKWKMKLYKFK